MVGDAFKMLLFSGLVVVWCGLAKQVSLKQVMLRKF
tara:strand:- start:4130 stop:4237 length:108 start_codon:yes stop_codon:yes gene_type:complete